MIPDRLSLVDKADGCRRHTYTCLYEQGLREPGAANLNQYRGAIKAGGLEPTEPHLTPSNPTAMPSYAVIGASRGIGLEYVLQLVKPLSP